MENDNEFWKQFSGSATANIVVIILYGIAKFLQSRCKHSRVSNVRSILKIQFENQLKEVIIKMYDLKKACKNCLPQSILKYQRDINRLFKLVGKETLPSTGKWLLESKLMEAYSKLPLSIALVKFMFK